MIRKAQGSVLVMIVLVFFMLLSVIILSESLTGFRVETGYLNVTNYNNYTNSWSDRGTLYNLTDTNGKLEVISGELEGKFRSNNIRKINVTPIEFSSNKEGTGSVNITFRIYNVSELIDSETVVLNEGDTNKELNLKRGDFYNFDINFYSNASLNNLSIKESYMDKKGISVKNIFLTLIVVFLILVIATGLKR